jgi:endonuclease/exonuclease/phosphatase family metal-dependent hydrolase
LPFSPLEDLLTGTRRASSGARIGIVGAIAIALLMGMVGTVAAKDKRDLTVMTQNLYLGADLSPVLAATNFTDFLIAVATIYGNVQYTDFPARATAIAAEIDAAGADIVGLQEVSNWTSSGPGAPPSVDFLAILQQALADRGLSYSVAAVSHDLSVGPIPLLLCSGSFGSCLLSYEDRDVILVNDDTAGLEVSNARTGTYDAQFEVTTVAGPISFDRGWATVEGRLEGNTFKFATTHLETEEVAAIQEAQAQEFLAGPARGGGAVIAVGDFNSAADGSSTATYDMLTKSWFADAWALNPGDPGFSCCQNATLTNSASLLYERVDLVLTHGAARGVEAYLVGDSPFQATPPLWPSDHAGLVATVRIH